ncbi:MAG: TatD family hydrolase [Alphaproteobacteria bacterium]
MWIDSHCHLNHSGIKEKGNPAEIIESAREVGVDGMLTVCCRMSEEIDELIAITKENDNVWCSIGTHPHDAGLDSEKSFTQSKIVEIAQAHNQVIALGETGLDYYYDNSPREDQQHSFRKHIRACIESDLPMIVHTRDAEQDTASIMKEEGQGTSLSAVMHCFSSSQWLAEQALDMGFYISFSGIITFKKADELRETAKIVPLDKVLVETDAPFLAPVPYRGKTNEPAYVTKTGEFLAELYGVSTDEFARITTENFYNLFTKAQQR